MIEIKRPILVIAIGYIIGIIIGLYFKYSIALLYILIAIVYVIIKRLMKEKTKLNREKLNLMSIKRYFRYLKLFINSKIIITICIFSIISNTITIFQNNKYENLYKDEEKIKGVALVISERKEKEYNYMYKIKIININKKGTKNTYLYLRVNKKSKIDLEYGDIINFEGEFQEPSRKRNYKGFDYRQYLKSIKIYGTVKGEKIEILEKNKGNLIISLSNKISYKMKEKINNLLNEKEANMLLGLLIGDDEQIDEDIQESFKISSLSHVLAVSGMQVTYIITGMFLVLKNSFGKRNTKIIIIICLIFYTILTGFSASIVRASIMGILIMGAGLFYRKNDIWTSISISLLIMLIYNPFLITNIGLQLSYLGTLGILIFNKTIYSILRDIKIKDRRYKYRINRKLIIIISKIKEILAITISASLTVYPIMLYNFNLFGTYFLITNLLVSTIIGPLTILGTIVVIISFIYFELAMIFSGILELFIDLLILISDFSKLPFSKIYVTTPNIVTIVIIYIIFIIFHYIYKLYHDKKLNPTQRRIRNLIALYKYKIRKDYILKIINYKNKIITSILIIIICISVLNFYFIKKDLKIYFVDVGQGDSSFIVTPKNKTILIDGGGSTSSDFDVGKNTLIPYLLDRGYKEIDYMFISHFDEDHVGSLLTVLEELKVNRVIISKQEENSSNYEKFLKIIDEKKIPVLIVKMRDRINIEKNIYFDILWPKEKQIEENKLNNNAIVMKLNYNNFSMLFTGDIEKLAEEEICKTYKNSNILESTILKVAHHGSKTSSTEEFLEKIKPNISLIGVGENNMFGHPSKDIIERLEKKNIKIYRTDLNGEISIRVNKRGKIYIKSLY